MAKRKKPRKKLPPIKRTPNDWWNSTSGLTYKPLTPKKKAKLWKDIFSKCFRESVEPGYYYVRLVKQQKLLNGKSEGK